MSRRVPTRKTARRVFDYALVDDDGFGQEGDTSCQKCMLGEATNEDPMLLCDGEECSLGAHLSCLGLLSEPKDEWFCVECSARKAKRDRKRSALGLRESSDLLLETDLSLQPECSSFWQSLGVLLSNHLHSLKGSKLTSGRLPTSVFYFPKAWAVKIFGWLSRHLSLCTTTTDAGIWHVKVTDPGDLCSLWTEETVVLWVNLSKEEFVWVRSLEFVWTPPRRNMPIGTIYFKYEIFKGDSRNGLQIS
jgi:hypothetical protein